MRKRSEIKKLPPIWCGEDVPGSICGLPLERRAEGAFCVVHGYNIHVLNQEPEPQPKESVQDVSAKLSEQLDESSRAEIEKRQEAIRQHAPRPEVWASANKAKEKPIREDFGRITESLFINDVEDTWKKLEEQLRIGEERSDRGVLLRALDNAEHNARQAHRLYITAQLEQTRYELTNKVIFAAIRDEANRVLQREKDQKLRSKQISEEDIENMAAQLYADEYEAIGLRRKKAELMVKSLQNLAELWVKRCTAIEVMLGKAR